MRAEKDADGEEAPGHHGPAAGDVNPFFAGILHDERAQREGEGDGEADVSEIEHGRMDDHLGILQKRIQAGAIGGKRALHDGEGVRGKIQNQQKENLHRGDDHGSVGEQPLIGLVAQAENESVAGQQQRPEQQRTFLPGPEHGELVGGGQIAIAVMEDVGDGEVVVERGQHQNDAGQQHGGESGDSGAAGGFAQTSRSGVLAEQCQRSPPGKNTHSGRAPAAAQSFQFETSLETPLYL